MIKNKIFHGDCINWLNKIQDESIDLIYIDPPFFTQRDFKDFTDKWTGHYHYIKWLRARLLLAHKKLKQTGSIYVHCDYRANFRIRVILNHIFGEDNFKNEIIWCYASGGASNKTFSKKHDTIFFYTKTKMYNFYPVRIKEKRNEKSLKRAKAKNGRIGKLGFYRYPFDIFNIDSLGIMSGERTGWPTQKPLKLLERIIKASSNEGDLVLDFFGGSGTTSVAAHGLKRRFITGDISEKACKIMVKRLEKAGCNDFEF